MPSSMSVLPYTIIYRGELIQTYRATEFVPGGPDWRIHEVESHRLGWPATAGGTSVPQRAAACCRDQALLQKNGQTTDNSGKTLAV